MMPSFSFQGVWDKLYLNPLHIKGHTELLTVYFSVLGFTRLVEWLGLCMVLLPSLQYWFSKLKGANLVEASIPTGNTEMALAY